MNHVGSLNKVNRSGARFAIKKKTIILLILAFNPARAQKSTTRLDNRHATRCKTCGNDNRIRHTLLLLLNGGGVQSAVMFF